MNLTAEGAPTNRQMQILVYILGRCDDGFPPTRRDIMRHFGMKSPNAAECHLVPLEQKGLIAIDRRHARGIRPLVRLEMYDRKKRIAISEGSE